MPRIFKLFIAIILFTSNAFLLFGGELIVSPKSFSGTFLEIEEWISKDIKQREAGVSTIISFEAGDYRVNKGLKIGNIENIIIKSEEGALVRLFASQEVNPVNVEWSFYEPTQKKLLKIDISNNSFNFFNKIQLNGFASDKIEGRHFTIQELYLKNKTLPLSRWPNINYSKPAPIIDLTPKIKKARDKDYALSLLGKDVSQSRLANWSNEKNIIFHGYWRHLWADSNEVPAFFDLTKGYVHLAKPYNHYLFNNIAPYRVLNAICEIDEPGEWAYDAKEKVYWVYHFCF